MATLGENLTELIAQKERIASEVNSQSEKITAIKSDIYDILESDEIPQSKLASFFNGSITEVTENDLAGATRIKMYSFEYLKFLTSVAIPKTITKIETYAFNNCYSLTSVTFEESSQLTTIEMYSFQSCPLTSINLEDTILTTIGSYAFRSCSSLTSVTIPASVTSIGSNALQIGSTTTKATIRFLGTTPPSIYSSTFEKNTLNQIIVPKGYGEVYKTATNFSNFADYIVEATE